MKIAEIEKVAIALQEMNDEVVFIGGSVLELYATEEGADIPRPTKDIDISVQVSTYAQMTELAKRLSEKGFYPAQDEKVIYRYKYEHLLVDFIPLEDTSPGSTNKWLETGFDKAINSKAGEKKIKILPVSYFLASKWQAYLQRGGDFRQSHDFEDIIYVLDNYADVEEIIHTDAEVLDFLADMSDTILSESSLEENIEIHLDPEVADDRAQRIIDILLMIKETAKGVDD